MQLGETPLADGEMKQVVSGDGEVVTDGLCFLFTGRVLRLCPVFETEERSLE